MPSLRLESRTVRRDQVLGAEGAVLFLEKISHALEHVDSSSGAIGTAVNNAIDTLATMGRKEAALQYAEESHGLNESPSLIAAACEEILLSEGLADEAYRHALLANRKTTNLATFRAIAQKYPHKSARDILDDLAKSTPGQEGKWFAAARSAGLLAEALELVNNSPCDPKTLTTAVRDMAEIDPDFAVEAGLAALKWLARGYGYEISGADVWSAYLGLTKAAENAGRKDETIERVRMLLEKEGDSFVSSILGRTLGQSRR